MPLTSGGADSWIRQVGAEGMVMSRMAEDQDRPAPDVLLEQAKKEGRGRLKIFLGPYPGVGKTYAMLQAAQERRREGVDVVVGVVETHGRAETEALLRGLEVVARRKLAYRGRVFGEMDLDACSGAGPSSRSSTSSRTPTCRAPATSSAIRTSRSCLPPASTSTRRSTSSTSRA